MKLVGYISFFYVILMIVSCGENKSVHQISLGESVGEIQMNLPLTFDSIATKEFEAITYCESELQTSIISKNDTSAQILINSPLHFNSQKCSYLNKGVDESFLGQLIQYYQVKNLDSKVTGEILNIDSKPCAYIRVIQNISGNVNAILKTYLEGRIIEIQLNQIKMSESSMKEIVESIRWVK